MAKLLQFPDLRQIPKVVYLSADIGDVTAKEEAEEKVKELGQGAYLVHEPLMEWKCLQELKVLDLQRQLSLEFLIIRSGSHEVKEEILFNRSRQQSNKLDNT